MFELGMKRWGGRNSNSLGGEVEMYKMCFGERYWFWNLRGNWIDIYFIKMFFMYKFVK